MNLIPIDPPDPLPNRRLAPFAKEVIGEVRKGRSPNVYVFSGRDAWSRAKQRRDVRGPGTALVLPHGEDPAEYRWPPLDALFADARALDRKTAIALGIALIGDGVRFAAVLAPGDEPLTFRRAGGKI